MLEDLIKLSEELARLDMSRESLEIEHMIERLYSNGADTSARYSRESEEESLSPTDALRILIDEGLSGDEDFISSLAEMLLYSLEEADLHYIMDQIAEAIE